MRTLAASALVLAALPVAGIAGVAQAQEIGPTEVTVTNADPAGWEIESDPITDGGGIGFTSAPDEDLEDHPKPPGNLLLVTDEPQAGGGTHRITTADPAGTTLEDLTLAYSTLVTDRPGGSEAAPYLILEADLVVPGGGTSVPATLVFEPRFTDVTSEDAWQQWGATAANAVWWSVTLPPALATKLCTPMKDTPSTDDLACTWEEILDAQGQATVRSVSLGIGDPLRSGDEAWRAVEAHADALLVGTDTGETLYDFELVTAPAGGHDAFGLGAGTNEVWRFDMVTRSAFVPVPVSGIGEGETLVGIDFHPVSGDLFGVTVTEGGLGRVYNLGAVDAGTLTGELITPTPFPLLGGAFGVSFAQEPETGRHFLHTVSDQDVHLAVDGETGAAVPRDALAYEPTVGGALVDPAVIALTDAPDDLPGFVGVDVRTGSVPHLVGLPGPGEMLVDRGELGLSTNLTAGLDAGADGSVFGVFHRSISLDYSNLYAVGTDASTESLGRNPSGFVLDDVAIPPTGLVGFQDTGGTVPAGPGTFAVNVERRGGIYGELLLDVVDVTATASGSAIAGDDYTLDTSQVHFEPGSPTSDPIQVTINRPADADGSVTVLLRLADARKNGTGHFVDDEETFTLTIQGRAQATIEFAADSGEVEEGDGTATLTVTRTGGDTPSVSARVKVKSTGDPDEATAGDDYTGIPTEGVPVEFPDDDGTPNSVTVPVAITNDVDAEGNERAIFELTSPSTGALIGSPSEVTLTIEDDPVGTVAFNPTEYVVDEGGTVEVVVERTGGNEGDTTIQVSDALTGTAVPGEDYEVFALQSHTFPGANDGASRSQGFEVRALPSAEFDGTRFVELELTKTGGSAAVGDSTATVTIRDLTQGNAFLVTDNGDLASTDPNDPALTVSTPATIEDESGDPIDLAGIDFRPKDGKLYGVAIAEGTQVYEIDPVAGVGTLLSPAPVITAPVSIPFPSAPALLGDDFGVDFEATDDTLRVVSDIGGHLVFNASTWQWSPEAPFAYGPGDVPGADPDPGLGTVPSIVAVAHDQNVDPGLVTGEAASTAYAVDAAGEAGAALVRIGGSFGGQSLPAESGLLTTIGDLPATDAEAGLDVTTDGLAFAVLTDGGASTLFGIDLATGAADDLGEIDGGPYTDIALAPTGVIKFGAPSYTVTGEVPPEGETDKVVTVQVTRVGGTAGEVTLDFAGVDGTAPGGAFGNGVDFVLDSGGLVFDDGSAGPQDVTLTIHDDDDYEGNESLTVRLSNLAGAVFQNSAATLPVAVTIQDDPVGTLAFKDAPYAVDEDAGPAEVKVERTGGAEGALTVDVSTQQRTTGNIATAGVDYVTTPTPTSLTFAHGGNNNILTATVAPIADHDEELDEMLNVLLSNPSVPGFSLPAATQLTIQNDDHAGSIKLSAATYAASEDAGSLVVTLERTGGSDGAIAVDFGTTSTGHTATAGNDYTATSERVTFSHEQTTKAVAVAINNDSGLEGDETFGVSISNPTNIPGRTDEIVSPSTATATIRDAEPGALLAVVADTDTDGAQELVRFDAARPDTITMGPLNLSGLDEGQRVVALDRRADDGEYYALGVETGGGDATLYRLAADGSLTGLGTLVDGVGNAFPVADQVGMAIDPVRDVVRIVDADGQNLRIAFPTGPATTFTVIEDNPVWYQNGDFPGVAAVAFTNASGSPAQATQYDLDPAHDRVARQGDAGNSASADGGRLTSVGTLTAGDNATLGFTVDQHDRLLATVSASPSSLYQVDLGSTARRIGTVGGGLEVDALAAAPSVGIGFAAAEIEVSEGGDTDRTEDVTVERTGSTSGARTFGYQVTDEVGGVVAEGNVEFADGQSEAAIPVPVEGDDVFRPDREFTLRLSGLSGVESLRPVAALTILDDDEPAVSFEDDDGSVSVDEGAGEVVLNLSLSNLSEKTTTVNVSAVPGTASASDFGTPDPTTVTFGPEVTQATVRVPITDDSLDEDAETFTVELSDPDNATLGAMSDVEVTIADDDDPPTVSVSGPSEDVPEASATGADFTVSLSAPSGKMVSVDYATVDETAVAGDDYEAATGTATFAPGETTETVPVRVINDTLDEPDETFSLELDPLSLENVDPDVLSAAATITDDDDPPTVSIGDPPGAAAEGSGVSEGSPAAVFTVGLSAPSAKTITLRAATSDGTAKAGSDYEATVKDLTFKPGGPTSQTVTVPLKGDGLDEVDEVFTVALSDLVNVDAGVLSTTASIFDDDDPPTISVNDVRVVEGDSGETEAAFTLTLSGPSAKLVRIAAHTVDDTATAGQDYAPASGAGFFAPGTVSLTGRAKVFGDTVDEPDESFRVVLTDPVNATVATGEGVVTILDDDEPAVVLPARVSSSTYRIVAGDGSVYVFDARGQGRPEGRVPTSAPVIAAASTPSGDGSWVLDSAGGIFTTGDAEFFGSLPALRRQGVPIGPAPVIDVTSTPSGDGYWVLDSKGGVFSFGDAEFFGSVPALRARDPRIGGAPIADIAPTPSGLGYWVLDANGGVFSFGDAEFFGSIPALRANDPRIGQAPAVALAPTPDGRGYSVLDASGGIFTFGNARFLGSVPGLRAAGIGVGQSSIVAMASTPAGDGYWILDASGGVFTFGSARFAGSLPGLGVSGRAIGFTV